MVQVTRIGGERVETKKIRETFAAVQKYKKEIWDSKAKKRFFRIDISFSFYCITNTLRHSGLNELLLLLSFTCLRVDLSQPGLLLHLQAYQAGCVLFTCHSPPGTIWLVWTYISHGDRRTVLRGQTETKLHFDTEALLAHSIDQSRSYGQAQMQEVEKQNSPPS